MLKERSSSVFFFTIMLCTEKLSISKKSCHLVLTFYLFNGLQISI